MKLRNALMIGIAASTMMASLPAAARDSFADGSFQIARRGGDDSSRSDRDDDRRSSRRSDDDDRGYGFGYERRHRSGDSSSDRSLDDRDRRNDEDRSNRRDRRDGRWRRGIPSGAGDPADDGRDDVGVATRRRTPRRHRWTRIGPNTHHRQRRRDALRGDRAIWRRPLLRARRSHIRRRRNRS